MVSKKTMRLVIVLASVAAAVSLTHAQSARPRGQLLDAVVFHAFLVTDTSAYSPDLRALIAEHAQRAKAYRPRPRPVNATRPGTAAMVYDARENYERRLVASVAAGGVDQLAQQYVDALRPCYEWEGYHDCPEREAQFAERYIKDNPRTPFHELLELLAAHRWLCAAAGYKYEEKPAEEARSRRASQPHLSAALKAQSLLIRAAAEELRTRAGCLMSGD